MLRGKHTPMKFQLGNFHTPLPPPDAPLTEYLEACKFLPVPESMGNLFGFIAPLWSSAHDLHPKFLQCLSFFAAVSVFLDVKPATVSLTSDGTNIPALSSFGGVLQKFANFLSQWSNLLLRENIDEEERRTLCSKFTADVKMLFFLDAESSNLDSESSLTPEDKELSIFANQFYSRLPNACKPVSDRAPAEDQVDLLIDSKEKELVVHAIRLYELIRTNDKKKYGHIWKLGRWSADLACNSVDRPKFLALMAVSLTNSYDAKELMGKFVGRLTSRRMGI